VVDYCHLAPDDEKRPRSYPLVKKAVLILAILIFSILFYMGVITRKETLPFSKEFFSIETPPAANLSFDFRGL